MKIQILASLLAISSILSAQTFNGVEISGPSSVFISKLKEKGYKFSKSMELTTILKGTINFEEVELFVYETPKSKQVFKMSIYFGDQETWKSIKSQYDRLLVMLTDKYGEPDGSYEGFKSPYYEGDGYEMSAITQEKCNYSAYWLNKGNLSLSLEITKFKEVRIAYENVTNMQLYKKEKAEQDKKIF